jgi:hypothetical protein
MNGNFSQKLDAVRQFILKDMKDKGASAQVQAEFNNVMNSLV